MKNKSLLILPLLWISLICKSQNETADTSNLPADTSITLGEVVVKAYEQNRRLKEAPVAINYVGRAQLERSNNISILPALNNTPGVRMEERSPASFRMNVRGSTLRSPFGVRNVKIYYNGIPFTDPGGGTYLNQLGYYNFNSIEIIKGPGGSLYGAGTGGVILINSQPERWVPGGDLQYVLGSYSLNNLNLQVRVGKEDRRNIIGYTHQTSDGYRDHTAMRRDVVTWESQLKTSSKQELHATILYGDLYYQTPGALNKAEYTANPKSARPAAGILPSADTARAAIYQKTFIAGITNTFQICDHFTNESVLYGAFSQIRNPTFRNYERRVEPHFGGRTLFRFDHDFSSGSYQLIFGAEAQKGFFNTKTFTNVEGRPGDILTDDDINNWIYAVFAQADLRLVHDWNITVGISTNKSSIRITRLSVPQFSPVRRTYNNEWAPRVAVSKKLFANLWMYGSISKGFSPPTAQEVLPSTSVISTGLEPEHGINYEAGIKSSFLKQRLYFEINLFSYQLKSAIVQRKDANNADFFTNAGSTKQKGIESQAAYQFFTKAHGFLSNGRAWISHTWNNFRYKNFEQGTNDYSGKDLPSVAPHSLAMGIDLSTNAGVYTHLSYFYSDHIALNDANTEYASSYSLFGIRLGWKTFSYKKWGIEGFAGAENLFNAKYSLGNDINAAGGRYYNAAAGRNYYAGLAIHFANSPKN